MSLFSVFKVTSSGMMAQSVRMNTIASNMANANNTSGDANKIYKAKIPVFQTVYQDEFRENQASLGVRVDKIVEDQTEPAKLYKPDNPLADKNGYIYKSNVNAIEEFTNYISASRTYQNNIEVMNSTKQLMMALLRMNQS